MNCFYLPPVSHTTTLQRDEHGRRGYKTAGRPGRDPDRDPCRYAARDNCKFETFAQAISSGIVRQMLVDWWWSGKSR